MVVRRFSVFDPGKRENLNVQGFVETCLALLDRFLVYIAENKPDILDRLATDLESRYKSAVSSSFEIKDTSSINSDGKILTNFPSLLTACVDFLLEMLNVPRNYEWQPEEIELLTINITRASQLHFYYRVKSLTELVDKEEAIQLLKDFIDSNIAKHARLKEYKDLPTLCESHLTGNQTGDWTIISIDKGRYINRADRCIPHEVLKGFNDPELAYIVACYADYARFKKMNENFVLTRTHTQFDGSYCDNCIHDKRYVDKIEHPSREVFENL
ncbi:MAG: L-2-amino-thiazoline-4-carboxylic acid hydrolase [Candidatus Odinarchaeota archaeon]